MSKQPGGTSFHMENFKRRSRYALVFILLILAFCVITVLNINTGNVHISLSEIADILLKKVTDTKEYSIIWKIRLPRILMAAILGGALSLSGFLLQTFFENPIAGPFVLGISSGAKDQVNKFAVFTDARVGEQCSIRYRSSMRNLLFTLPRSVLPVLSAVHLHCCCGSLQPECCSVLLPGSQCLPFCVIPCW